MLSDAIDHAQLLHDASEAELLRLPEADQPLGALQGGQGPGRLTLKLPVRRPDVLVPVVELFLRHAT